MTARDYALHEIDRTRLPAWPANLVRAAVEPPTDPRDLGLAEQICIGVIKNHALLEFDIARYIDRPKRLDPLVRKILAIGLYQLRFLARIPPPAVVDEAVEQTRRFGRPHAAGLVNAVLRRALREPEVTLPDPVKEPEKYATVALSHPPEVVRRLLALLSAQDMHKFCEHDNREPPTLVRLMKSASLDQLATDGITITPHERSGIHIVEGAKRAQFADWASRGIAQVQDATAAAVVEQLDIHPGNQVLDRCAGLGTKTLQICEFATETGWVMAVDPSPNRCEILRKSLTTRAIGNVAVVQATNLHNIAELKRPAFDRILVDAPCSNSGVMARRPEARYRQDSATIASLIDLQDKILDDTAEYLRNGGLMVYCTCSVWPDENRQRIDRFLNTHSYFQMVQSQSTWPSFDPSPGAYHDGGYFALLKRSR